MMHLSLPGPLPQKVAVLLLLHLENSLAKLPVSSPCSQKLQPAEGGGGALWHRLVGSPPHGPADAEAGSVMLRAGTRQEAEGEGTERRRLSCPAPGRAAWVKGDEAWTPRLSSRLGCPGWRPSPLSLRRAGPRAVSVLGGSPAAARSGAWQPQEACARAPSCAMGRRPPGIPWLGKAALTLGLVLLYYCFSIGITFYNKWLMKSFHFPLFMTLLHLLVIFLLSALTRALMHCYTKRSRVVLTWDDYLRRVAPTALSTALDIGLSNWSFLYITVSLYTMTKSSAILFILLFSLIFKLEELRMALVLVVLLIAGGLFMFTYESTQFNMEGFALVLGASFLGGIRWTLTQMLMQKAELGLQNPIDTMFHLQPLMFLGLFPLFAVFEGLPLSTSEKLFRFHEAGLLLSVVGKLSLGGFLAFGLGFSEFLLVSRTSSLTLSIAGIFKEICTLLLATHLLGDHLNLLNWVGFAVCLLGISLHVTLKAFSSKGEKESKLHKGTSSSPDLELLLRRSEAEEEEEEVVTELQH